MAAKVSVIWHVHATDRIKSAVEWCKLRFGERTAIKFYRRILAEGARLAYAPYIGFPEELLNDGPVFYRSLVVHRNFKLIYYVEDAYAELHIIDLWDVRRAPDEMQRDIL